MKMRFSSAVPLFYFLMILASLFSSATRAGAQAYTNADGLVYESDGSNQAAIVGYTGAGGEVTIPDTVPSTNGMLTVTTLADGAFAGAESLSGITIPDTVTNMGNGTFANCTNLVSASLSDVTSVIGDSDFTNCYSLRSISIPSGTSLGNEVFYGCSSLAGITLPDTLTNMGIADFAFCYSLPNITVPAGVAEVPYGAFYGCTNLTQVTLAGCSLIDDYAFYDCWYLAGVDFGPDLTSIGGSTFANCYRLLSVDLPNTMTNIGSEAFEFCVSMTNLNLGTGAISLQDESFSECVSLQSAALPFGMTNISPYSFYNDYSMTNVSIPGSVISIGMGAFLQCSNLTRLVLPEGVTSIGVTDTTSEGAFSQESKLASVSLPQSLTSIGFEAFSGDGLTNIVVPPNATTIGQYAFAACPNLSAATLPDGLPSIPAYLFLNCYSLSRLVLPPGITNVGTLAFFQTSIPSITIPDGVSGIGEDAFGLDAHMTNVCFQGNAPTDGGTIFVGDPLPQVYYVNGTTGWSSTFSDVNTAPCPECGSLDAAPIAILGIAPNGPNVFLRVNSIYSSWTNRLLVSTNASLPLSQWTPVATNVISTNGIFTITVTNGINSTMPHRFFILKSF